MYRNLFLFFCAVLVMSSCRYRHGKHHSGSGVIGNEQRSLTGFTGVETHGDIDIVVSQGNFSVRVEADKDLLPDIETVVENGRLIVRMKDKISFIDDHGSTTVYISAPELNAFETHGSGDVRSEGKITDKNKMGVLISGSGDIRLDLDCPEISTSTDGSGDITLSGATRNLSCKTSGSGDLHASDLKAENVKVTVHGSGDASVFASELLEVEISGSGDVHYSGAPKINTTVHGSGTVSKQD